MPCWTFYINKIQKKEMIKMINTYQFAAGLGTGLFIGLIFGIGFMWYFNYCSNFKEKQN
ncbi:MAG: hypothetical protein PWP22_1404 [Thermoanaerobacter sp.]|jgi:hypothetical protein|nr:hypothetical protein [Thermoanaerobacter sp.]